MDIDATVGRLYGNILMRNADREGYEHYHRLLSGGGTIREAVVQLMLSDEFIDKFIVNDTPNEIARKMITCLLSEAVATPKAVRDNAHLMLNKGYPELVKALAQDKRYSQYQSAAQVPIYG